MVQLATGWSKGQRALLRFLEQQGVLGEEPVAPADSRPTNADLFATFAASIDQQRLVDLVSEALRIGQVDLGTFTPMPDLVSLIPADVACSGEVVPIAQHDGLLEVAAANPLDLEMVKSVEFTTGLRVRTKIARREDVCRALAEAYGATLPEVATPAEVPAEDAAETTPALEAVDPSPLGEEPAEAVEIEASGSGETPRDEVPSAAPPAEPIRWSFDSADVATESVAAEEPVGSEEPVATDDADGGAETASWDVSGTSDGLAADEVDADDADANVPVYELDISLDDDPVAELARFDDVRLDDASVLAEPGTPDPVDEPAAGTVDPIPAMTIERAVGLERFPDPASFEPTPVDEPVLLDLESESIDAGVEASCEAEAEAEAEAVSDGDDADVYAEPPAEAENDVSPAWIATEEEPEVPSETPGAVNVVVSARPGVLVVSRDVGRRIALRDALEAATGLLCVLTMRDEIEARAVLGLGGVAVAVVDEGVVAGDGRPLWETIREHGTHVIVRGGDVTAPGVVSMGRDDSPLEIASRVRSIVKESVDG